MSIRNRLLFGDQTVTGATTQLIGSVDVDPNHGLMILAKGDIQFQVKTTHSDPDQDGNNPTEFDADLFTVPTTGATIKISPGGNKVNIYAVTTGTTAVKLRVYPRFME